MLSTPVLASIQYTYIAKDQLLNKVPSVDGSTTNAANGNITRRTTLVSEAPTGAYVQSSCDQRDQLTRVEFYTAQVIRYRDSGADRGQWVCRFQYATQKCIDRSQSRLRGEEFDRVSASCRLSAQNCELLQEHLMRLHALEICLSALKPAM